MLALIRIANSLDRDAIHDVHSSAFPEGENELVAKLAIDLLTEKTDPETISLVAEIDGAVVGHIAFSPVTNPGDSNWCGYILAPLGVRTDCQQRGIGSSLVTNGIERLSQQGVNVVFVYGDPKYYQRFGFKAETAANYLPPYELAYPFGWLATVLGPGGYPEQPVELSFVASLRDPALW